MKKKTIAPKCVRTLSIVSLVLSGLWILAYILCVVFQREIRPLFMTDPEALAAFYVPIAPIVGNALLLLVQAAASILICAFGKKAVWANWSALTMLLVRVVAGLPCGLIATVVSTFEAARINAYGSQMIAAYTTVNTTLGYAGYFFSVSNLCTLVALAILCYRCAIDAKAQRTGNYDA